MRGIFVSLLALALPLVSAAPTTSFQLAARDVPVPADDPFYTPPAGFESSAPGAVLRSRSVVTSFLNLIPDPVEAWQVLFRTTAVNGSAIASVTTVFKPVGAKLDRFVSFQTAYDGAARNGICQPSYNYRLGAAPADIIAQFEFFLLQAYLIDGYIVSSPDYEGPDSAFAAGRLEGVVLLDSMRAVGNFQSTLGLTTSNPAVVGYGYSGGAIGTGWAAGLQPTYAPELNVKGWASGGTPANLTGTAVYIDGTIFSGFLPQAIVGLLSPSAYEAQLEPTIDAIITAKGKQEIATAETICGVENLFVFPFQSFASYEYSTVGPRVFYEPAIAAVMEQQTMGVSQNITPTSPYYLYHAIPDEIIPYANASTLFHDWCGYGASVDFVTFANGGHLTTEILGFPGAFKFVGDAFAGTTSSGCSQQTVLDNTLDPLALGVSLEPILIGLLNVLGKLGNEDSNVKSNLSTLKDTI